MGERLGLGQIFDDRLELGAGRTLGVDAEFVQLPRGQRRRALTGDEERVERRPAPRMLQRRGVVIDRGAVQDAHHAVVQQDEGDRDEEREPRLVQRDHRDDHEEVEVHLDQPATHVDEHPGRRDERERGERRPHVGTQGPDAGASDE